MAARVVVGIIALVSVPTCGIITTQAYFEMVDRVNERLPASDQFAAAGWYLTKYRRLHREYKRLYPTGHLLRRVRFLTALMVACLLICAWSFGFFAASP